MKTVKRKAEVGEKVRGMKSGRIGTVYHVNEGDIWFGNGYNADHECYEVIVDESESNIPPHSSHYHQNGLDPLEVMRRTFPPEQYEGFLRGSLLKYTMRYDRKGQQKADLEKMNFYGMELERWKGEQE